MTKKRCQLLNFPYSSSKHYTCLSAALKYEYAFRCPASTVEYETSRIAGSHCSSSFTLQAQHLFARSEIRSRWCGLWPPRGQASRSTVTQTVCVCTCVQKCKREDEDDICQCKRNPRTIIAALLIFALMTDLSANNHQVNMIL